LAAVVVAVVTLFAVFGGDGPPEKLATAFADEFGSDQSGWEGTGTYISRYGYRNSQYRMETTSLDASQQQWLPKEKASDIPERALVSVTADVHQSAPDGRFGLFCRGNNTNDVITKYDFMLRHDGKGALLRKVAGNQGTKELANVDDVPGFDPEENRIQVACEPQDGNKQVRLRMWVNGEQVIDHTDGDQPLGHGWVGMRVERGGN
ncbi:hypothetical protein ACFQ07_10625, partial [Actinomadura adrarensis]